MTNDPHRSARLTAKRVLAAAGVLLAVAVLVIGGNALADWIAGLLDIEMGPKTEHIVHRLLMIAAAVYTVLIAIPFVPGVEIGFSMLMLYGAEIVLLLYLCTFVGLGLSFCLGCLIPAPMLARALSVLSFRQAADYVSRIAAMSSRERLALLTERAPSRLVPYLVRYRYLALALAFNVPGNSLIGGGGGIALLAGLSRLFSPPAFFATLAFAIAPVPLAVLLFGESFLFD